ncbi:nucleotide-diphospho-sugar transferase [Pedobacter fastidiosus]|uniref:Nucleotide-diphospho-sugar transferase n=1 Tax=Pedobacter fastidiosus TaxID=2765361 RepID=A0ABR7KTH3_9SPHI|nr:nucleotide-diphospho-sugar transferase [Pedobacter fastidiosus]MBC6111023.1 nucleotide-diphospho-sugar transferase [Pedobacter fastidiosus]
MMVYDQNVPILMLVFNRPELTSQVFDKVREVAPKYLYVAADGPRDQDDETQCKEVKAVFNKIDWDCELKTLFRDNNLGCGMAVSSGIQWFFNQVEKGIVLEDDCLPNNSFFGFCTDLLHHYNNDVRVGHISGSNFQDEQQRGDGSYYFSALTHVWGWASWKRVWKDYDYKISLYYHFDASFKAFPAHLPFASNWKNIFTKVAQGEINTWDYQYAFLNLIKGYKSIMPNVNLIKNIGLGINGTHTSADHPLIVKSTQEIDLIKHPVMFKQNVDADIYTQNKEFVITKRKKNLFSITWKKIKTYLSNGK